MTHPSKTAKGGARSSWSPYNAAKNMHTMAANDQFDRLSQRRITVAMIFIFCSLLSSGRIFWNAHSPQELKKSSIDIAQHSDQRFAVVKTALPQQGVIGYMGGTGPLARGDYYLAEYALAPLVVDDSLNHPLVLANFPDSPLPAPPRLQLVKNYGDGVAVFANKDAN